MKGEKIKEKTNKEWLMDKILVGVEESAVIWKCSINKVFEKWCKIYKKYMCWRIFLIKFQVLRLATLLKSDSRKGVFL